MCGGAAARGRGVNGACWGDLDLEQCEGRAGEEQMLRRREILTAAGESLQADFFMIRKVSVSCKQ